MYIVTGASSGIGQAIALELLTRGEVVLAVARREGAFTALEHIHSDNLIGVQADVSHQDGIERIYRAASGQPLKGIVHSAGSSIPVGDYASVNPENLVHDMAVHVAAPMALNNRFSNQLEQARIVYIDSYSASDLRVGWCGYSIVKAAAQMAAKAAKVELAPAEIVRVFPGGVRTPLVEAVLDSATDSPTSEIFKALDAAGKLVQPIQVGRFVADILLHATVEQLAARDFWDISNTADNPVR